MKTKLLILSLLLTGLVSCNSQEVKSGKQLKAEIKPIEKFKVNKKYDDKGNLIEFDSTYSSYYSTYLGDTLNSDSILRDFQFYFDQSLRGFGSNDFFGSDSTFIPGFFHNDFFEQQFFKQDEMMLRMIQEMDSIKNEFFRTHSLQRERLDM